MNNINLNEKYVFMTKNGWGEWKVQSIHSSSTKVTKAISSHAGKIAEYIFTSRMCIQG